MFLFVFLINEGFLKEDQVDIVWIIRCMIDVVIKYGGSYYLLYMIY